MLNRSSTTSLAVIIAALITGAFGFFAAKQTLRVEVTLPETGEEALSISAASHKIEDLSRELTLAEARIASLQERVSGEAGSGEVDSFLQRIQTLAEELRSKDQLIAELLATDAFPGGKAQQSVDGGQFIFDLMNCTAANRLLTCTLVVTNQGPDIQLQVFGSRSSRAFDSNGDEYKATMVRLGDVSSDRAVGASKLLLSAMPIHLHLEFQGFAGSSIVRKLEVATGQGHRYRYEFRDIVLSAPNHPAPAAAAPRRR